MRVAAQGVNFPVVDLETVKKENTIMSAKLTNEDMFATGIVIAAAGVLVLAAMGSVAAPWPLNWYLVLSLITFASLAEDKRRARSRTEPAVEHRPRRIPERRLHLFELLGGWPGSYLAQRYFHHKTRKEGYRVVFQAIALLHIAGWSIWLWLF